ncbi:MAG: hypothetical protein ACSLEN_01600 [Candidatus Malihini olakiniferum]
MELAQPLGRLMMTGMVLLECFTRLVGVRIGALARVRRIRQRNELALVFMRYFAV